MTKLNLNQSKALAGIIREHARLIRDLTAARALLKVCQEKQVCPVDFEWDLEEMKQKPEYLQIAKELDLIAVRIEQAAEEIDLNELLQKLPKETLPS